MTCWRPFYHHGRILACWATWHKQTVMMWDFTDFAERSCQSGYSNGKVFVDFLVK